MICLDHFKNVKELWLATDVLIIAFTEILCQKDLLSIIIQQECCAKPKSFPLSFQI
jgi:hypothetical protein